LRPFRVSCSGWSPRCFERTVRPWLLSWSCRGPRGRRPIARAGPDSGTLGRPGSDSLAFVAPFMTSARCQVGLQGFPEPAVPLRSGEIAWSSHLHLRLSFRVFPSQAGPLSETSSHGIRIASPSTSPHSRPLPPAPESQLRPPDTNPAVSFRPRGFAPPRRLAPQVGRGSVASHSRPEVRHVSGVSAP
jgi:hypothetical protein